ncbi:XRE family transcriptional regulator [Flavobacterium humi]|uniref:XRE family transcriptional regulator n=1 Tax=Flavobacterium humi TaxID=2562683 RepID=A0A4Z0L7P5_9FLAO|nr:XRE family transcriptional regulator [Flavobacterium humi]TGD57014.1 XRE family transcriptional regulator [Flavobacterium humi]
MKDTTIKDHLGLTQEEMAMLLRITVSQWSMYKSGKRNIPADAKKQLGFLLKGVQEKKQDSKITEQFLRTEKEITKQKLKQDYLKAQIKIYRLEKEIETVEKQRLESFAALEAVHYLETQPQEKYVLDLLKIIQNRADKALIKHSLYKLEQMHLQKEAIEIVKDKIGKKL